MVFLLPLIFFYELASFTQPNRVIAFDLLRWFIELFGRVGMWAPGLAVVESRNSVPATVVSDHC